LCNTKLFKSVFVPGLGEILRLVTDEPVEFEK
jgi:hypothetical protein